MHVGPADRRLAHPPLVAARGENTRHDWYRRTGWNDTINMLQEAIIYIISIL
jgi:hypothetical protein